STTTSTPARASSKPIIMPAGPPPAIAQSHFILSTERFLVGCLQRRRQGRCGAGKGRTRQIPHSHLFKCICYLRTANRTTRPRRPDECVSIGVWCADRFRERWVHLSF